MSSEEFQISDATNLSLNEWQKHAIAHFTTLSNSKKEKKLPVFALEHCFSNVHIELITNLLIKDFVKNGFNRSYWLLWVIYSTEIGYTYTGEEYWQSFKERIQNWDQKNREDIRWSFKEFTRRFEGLRPTGAWANQFSIIALPITHAILPRDLQSHFASLLFFCRYKLRQISFANPENIGKLLNANSFVSNSSRFQNFLQQEELVGRIALSLLDTNAAVPSFELIHEQTLKRIVNDLELKRNAKEWVRETRKEITPKILGTVSSFANQSSSQVEAKELAPQRDLLLKPKLKLYQTEKKKWSVIIEIPQITDSSDYPELGQLLKRTRFQLAGVQGNWHPAESLLYGSLKKRFTKWPDTTRLIKFEQQHFLLEKLLEEKFTLTEEPWLFRINADGTASEIEGKFLRPGRKYIAIYNDQNQIPAELQHEVSIDCSNISAREILVPKVVSDDLEATYKSLGFEVFKTLSIWPAGLYPRGWDGEGTSEWLTTESPCFGIIHDYDVNEIQVKIASETITIQPKRAGEATFIKIAPLPPGQHFLSIKPKSRIVSASEGLHRLDVREPVIWTPGSILYNGLTAILDPNDDNFDSFFHGKTNLKLNAPLNSIVSIKIEFFLGTDIIETYNSQPINLPFNDEKLKIIRSQIEKRENYGIAEKARLTVSCEDIGKREFILTRNVKPFRWVNLSKGDNKSIRLIDEIDSSDEKDTFFYDILKPDTPISLSEKDFSGTTDVKNYNGLFWAKKQNYEHGIILSDSATRAKDLKFLSISPKLNPSIDFDLLSFLKIIQAWYNAQSTSFITQIHLAKVISVLVGKLYGELCGALWAQHEADFITPSNFNNDAWEALSDQIINRSMSNVLRYRMINNEKSKLNYTEEVEWFVNAAKRCQLTEKRSLALSSIKFASDPLSFIASPEELNSLARQIKESPDILRASRMFVLGVSKLSEPFKDFALLSPGGVK